MAVTVLAYARPDAKPGGYVSTTYNAAEIDVIGAYSPELRSCFLIPIAGISARGVIHLRLDPTRNNQAQRIKWAREYEFEAMIPHLRTRWQERHAQTR